MAAYEEDAGAEAITAQLVDEDALPEAAQREMNRLRRQVTELRTLLAQQQQQQPAAMAPIVLAEALPNSQTHTTNSTPRRAAAASRELARPQRQPLGVSTASSSATVPAAATPSNYPGDNKKGRRIHYSALKLKMHGREKEKAMLQNCLDKAQTQKQLVMISGSSGCGKTLLAESLRPVVEQDRRGLFVAGKFDLYLRDQPYYAFVAACEQICVAVRSFLFFCLFTFALSLNSLVVCMFFFDIYR